MTDARELRCDIAEIIGLVANARLQADGGEPCDLAGIVPRVDAVCSRLQAMPREDALRLVPLVEKLMGDLDAAGRAMERRRRRILGDDWRAGMEATLRP